MPEIFGFRPSVCAAPQLSRAANADKLVNTMPRNLRVFVAEDSAHVLRALKSLLLSITGVEVIGEATDAATALASIRQGEPDVAILDLRLSASSGLDILRGLQSDSKQPPVRIVFTNQAESRWRSVCAKLGADHFFNKSADADRLADLVRAMARET